jgi:Mrp family chromosome partitioning ATPase/capsular polysaccharide biosynthesis protein
MNRSADVDPVIGQQASSQGDTLDLRAYARPIWRWKWVVLAIAVLAAGGTYALTSREAKTYVASTQVLVQDADPAGSVTTGPPTSPPYQQQLQDLATLFTGPTITSTVYSRLGLPVGSAGSVAVSAETTSDFLDLTASSHSPVLAARLANTYAQVFLASQAASVAAAARAAATSVRDTLRTIPSTGTANQVQRYTLLAQLAQYDRVASNPSPGASVLGSAAIPSSPSSPRPARDAVFAGIIGLLLGIVLAFVLDLTDRRLVRVSAVQSIFDRPVLAVLPHVSNPAPRMNGSAATPPEFVEAMRGLRVNLGLVRGERSPKSVIVTSGLPGEGKSTVARDLAFAYAEAGERVLLIDCDLRRPSLARMFAVEPALGLVQVLRGEAGPAQAAVMVFRTAPSSLNGSTGQGMAVGDPRVNGSITLLAHGGHVESATALLSSPGMTGLLSSATSLYDVVILDTSPILAVSDAVPLLDQVGAVLFVARLGTTTREAAQRLAEVGQRVPGMNLVGVVVNDMRNKYVDEGYSYASQNEYAYSDAPRPDASTPDRVTPAARDDHAR